MSASAAAPAVSSTAPFLDDNRDELEASCSYEFVKRIGRGNYGTAWLVRRTRLLARAAGGETKSSSGSASLSPDVEDHVVIKKIPLHALKDDEVAAAEQEVNLLKQLRHPNIVRTMASFHEDETLHIVMQYCECGDLAMRIKAHAKKEQPFSRRQVLEWFIQIVSAVGYCHSKNILHRDLKTNNVFLARNNVIKLGDFGIAKVLAHSLEAANTVIGTPFYMSPEICSNKPYSFKSDMVRAPPQPPPPAIPHRTPAPMCLLPPRRIRVAFSTRAPPVLVLATV